MRNWPPEPRIGRVRCDRCHNGTHATIMSMFNKQEICPACKDAEKEHPRYAEALEADEAAIRAGDFNFPGIGLPADLRPRRDDNGT